MAFFDLRNARHDLDRTGDDVALRDEGRERRIDAMWYWSSIASAFLSIAATGWLAIAIWRAA
jgi:hypothetical protein